MNWFEKEYPQPQLEDEKTEEELFNEELLEADDRNDVLREINQSKKEENGTA